MPATSQEVKQVLLKWKVDTSSWKAALADILQQVSEVRKSDSAARSDDKQWLEYRLKQIRLSIGDIRSEVNERVKATRQVANQVEQQKLLSATAATTKAQHQATTAALIQQKVQQQLLAATAATTKVQYQAATAALIQQKAQQQQVTAAAAATTAQQRATTAQIQTQTAALKLQLAQQRLSAGIGGGRVSGGGGGGGRGGGFFGGLFGLGGSSFGGILTGAVAAGTLLSDVLEGLAVKMKRFIESSGPLQQVREQFEKLSQIKGIDATKFLDDLRTATHNLVNDVELYRTANKFMQSGVKATEEQMTALTRATVGLARAQGRDATQAINALNQGLATGRFMALGRITGLNREDLAVRGLSATMSDAARKQAEFNKALEAITKRFEAVGEPAETFTEKLNQISVVTTRLFQSFARGFVQSEGMKQLFAVIASGLNFLSSQGNLIEELGRKLGVFLVPAIEGVKALISVVSSLKTLIVQALEAIKLGFVIASFGQVNRLSDDFVSRLTTITGLAKTIAETFVLVKYTIKEVVDALATLKPPSFEDTFRSLQREQQFLNSLKDASALDQLKAIPSFYGKEWFGIGKKDSLFEKSKSNLSSMEDELVSLEQTFKRIQTPSNVPFGGVAGTGIITDTDENIALQRKLAQLRMKLEQDTAKGLLDIQKQSLQAQKDANEESYRTGLEILAEYVAKKKQYRQEELNDTLREIEQEREARLKELRFQLASGQIQRPEFALEVKDLDTTTESRKVLARSAAAKEIAAIDRQQDEDEQKATQIRAQSILEVRQEELKQEQSALEDAQKNGEITLSEYVTRRKALLQDELVTFISIEELKYKSGAQTQVRLTETQLAEQKKRQDIENQLVKLQSNIPELQLRQAEVQSQRQLQFLEAERRMAQSFGPAGRGFVFGSADQTKATENLISQYEKLIKVWTTMMSSGLFTGDEFLKLADKIAQANAEIVRLQESIVGVRGVLGSGFGQIAEALSSIGLKERVQTYNIQTRLEGKVTVPVLTQLRDALASASKIFDAQEAFSKWATQAGLGARGIKSPMDELHEQLQKSFDLFGAGVGTAKSVVDSFSSALGSAVTQVQQFATSISGVKSPQEEQPSGSIPSLIARPSQEPSTSSLGKELPESSTGVAGPASSAEQYDVLSQLLLNTPSFIYETMLQQLGAAATNLPVTAAPVAKEEKNYVERPKEEPTAAQKIQQETPEQVLPNVINSLVASLGSVSDSLTAFVDGLFPKQPKQEVVGQQEEQRQRSGRQQQTQPAPDAFSLLTNSVLSLNSTLSSFAGRQQFSEQPQPATQPSGGTPQPASNVVVSVPGLGAVNPSGATTRQATISPVEAVYSSFSDLVKHIGDVTKNLQDLTKSIAGTIQQIGAFASALQGQGGPLQAGITGAISGQSIGQGIGKVVSGIGSLFGASLSFAGPIGAAAGAAIGLFGGIFGGKARKAAEDIAKTITDQITVVMRQFATQQTTLAQTIQQLQEERQQAITQLSGKKGGRDQLNQILPQLDQQITQLEAQQAQILKQLRENLQIVSSPTAFQPLLQSVQAIIDQYKQYINAGGNVVEANQFLKDSFANLRVTNLATLNQDEQDAINNALQYNDLLLQRQQYLAQTNQQIQDIIAAGAPTRMRTQAQTKLAQIEQIELQRNQQLLQMNEQISVAGYRLKSEEKIFNLAQDRVGLETQLAQLQMQTIDQDIARIAALKELINVMSGTQGSALVAAIIAALSGAPTSSTAGLLALLQALGLAPPSAPVTPPAVGPIPPVPPGVGRGGTGVPPGVGRGFTQNSAAASVAGVSPVESPSSVLDAAFQALYANRGRQGFGGFNGELG